MGLRERREVRALPEGWPPRLELGDVQVVERQAGQRAEYHGRTLRAAAPLVR